MGTPTHGQGTVTSPDGLKYVGGYKDGKKNGLIGTGNLVWNTGDMEYVGEYKNGI